MPATSEHAALQFSMAASAVGGVIGVAFAVASGSDAVLLDGVYSLVSFGMAWVAARITGMILAPSTVHFPFGKAALEPVVNLVRAAVILIVLTYAGISAVGALSGGGAPAAAGPAVVYGLLVGLGGLAVARRQSALAQESGSAILAVDAASWRADGAISLSVGAAFVVALGLSWAGLQAWVSYVDPVTVLLLGAYLVREPWAQVRKAAGELLVEAPPVELQDQVFAAVDRALADVPCEEREIKLWKLGRHLTVRVTLLMQHGADSTTYDALDAIRAAARSELEGLAHSVRVDVLFTADRRWLDPSSLQLANVDSPPPLQASPD